MLSCNDAGNFQSILKLKMIKCEVYRSFQTLGGELWRSTLARIVYPNFPTDQGEMSELGMMSVNLKLTTSCCVLLYKKPPKLHSNVV